MNRFRPFIGVSIDRTNVPNSDPLGDHLLHEFESLSNKDLPHVWVGDTIFAPAISPGMAYEVNLPTNNDEDLDLILGRWSSYYRFLEWNKRNAGQNKTVGKAQLLFNDQFCTMVAERFAPSIAANSKPDVGESLTQCVMHMQEFMHLQQCIINFRKEFCSAPHVMMALDYMVQAVTSLKVSI